MPHGPISRKSVTLTSTDLVTASTYGPYINHSTGTELAQFTYHEEPASVSNPVRPNGTRAVSAYYAKNVVIVNSFAQCTSSVPIAGWYVKEGLPAPRFARFGSDPSGNDVINWFVKPVGFDVENRAKTKFLLNLASKRGKNQFDLGVFAGELRETAGMAIGLARSFVMTTRNLARSIERSSESVDRFFRLAERIGVEKALIRKAAEAGASEARLFESIVDGWLTYQLGVKPLIYDMEDMAVLLMADVSSPLDKILLKVKGGASGEYTYSQILCEEGLNGSWCRIVANLKQSVKIDYSCVYSAPANVTPREQLGVDNFAAVAYNLVRYTWLFDYAVGMGDWLSSFTAANFAEFLEGTRSRTRKVMLEDMETVLFVGDLYGSVIDKDPAKAPALVDIQLFERDVMLSGVTPAALPGLKHSLSLTQLANAVSILKNFF